MTLDQGNLATRWELDDGSALAELQHKMSACADLAELRAVLEKDLVPLLPVTDRVSIVFLEPDGEWLRIHRIVPVVDATQARLPRVRVDGTPVGQVVREGIGRIVADVRSDPNITFGHVSHDGVRSTVSVPVKIGGRVIGAMNAGSRTIGACTAEMLPRMEYLAAVIGPAFYAAEQALSVPKVSPRAQTNELSGSGPAFRALLATAQRAARSDADILITGETGVGKTALARAMHEWSPRRGGPFVTVHLADLAPTLVESELFGYERGAFTGAAAGRIGRFESAEGGTIFLDEIGETPLALQTKLLRLIQDRCFERVGSGKTIEANVRVIAATNIDLRAAIRRREFREDLYFRLSVVPLHVPPLRDRREDLELLVGGILTRLSRIEGRVRKLTPAAWERIRAYHWPGNIRELESVLRRATILEEGDELVLEGLGVPLEAIPAPPAAPVEELKTRRWPTLEEHERSYIEQVLQVHGGAVEGAGGAARVLGLAPSTLRSKMKRLGITPNRSKGGTR